jgi:hypothetical protein
VIGVLVFVVVFLVTLWVLFIMNKYGCLFDKQIINISHKRLDGYIEEREDGVYMLSNGKWICLDKKR